MSVTSFVLISARHAYVRVCRCGCVSGCVAGAWCFSTWQIRSCHFALTTLGRGEYLGYNISSISPHQPFKTSVRA